MFSVLFEVQPKREPWQHGSRMTPPVLTMDADWILLTTSRTIDSDTGNGVDL